MRAGSSRYRVIRGFGLATNRHGFARSRLRLLGLATVWAMTACSSFTQTAPAGFSEFPAEAKLTGRFTFKRAAPVQRLEPRYRPPSGQIPAHRPRVDDLGYFHFLDEPTFKLDPGQYQIVWDSGGIEIVDRDVNVVGLLVSDSLTSPPAERKTPQFEVDLFWQPNPVPGPSETLKNQFSFAPYSSTGIGPIEYFATVLDSRKGAVVDTATVSGSPIAWGGKDNSGNAVAAGDYFYQLKFQRAGTVWGGKDLHGATKPIRIKIR